jgi:hypothetical protein
MTSGSSVEVGLVGLEERTGEAVDPASFEGGANHGDMSRMCLEV